MQGTGVTPIIATLVWSSMPRATAGAAVNMVMPVNAGTATGCGGGGGAIGWTSSIIDGVILWLWQWHSDLTHTHTHTHTAQSLSYTMFMYMHIVHISAAYTAVSHCACPPLVYCYRHQSVGSNLKVGGTSAVIAEESGVWGRGFHWPDRPLCHEFRAWNDDTVAALSCTYFSHILHIDVNFFVNNVRLLCWPEITIIIIIRWFLWRHKT